MRNSLAIIALFAAALTTASADVTLPPLISDHMVLQQPKASLWGKADPGESVSVMFGNAVARTTADKDGKWRVELNGLRSGATGEITVAGKNKLTIKNVLVGDVWVCSGQSNMSFPLIEVINANEVIARANSNAIRMFTVSNISSETPVEEVQGKWEVSTPETVKHWAAVGYLFARKLHDDLGIPVGMINSSWGATSAQVWTPAEAFLTDPELKGYPESWKAQLAHYPEAKERYENTTLPAWHAAVDVAKAAGQPIPEKPFPPSGPNSPAAVSGLYNAMILGLTKSPIKGVVWYQGEGNVGDPHYRKLLSAMITFWRKAWGQGDFPFLIVQLANFLPAGKEPAYSYWAETRDVQRLTLDLPNTGMAVALDVGEPANIHPRNKQDVACRLALIAESKGYGKNLVYSGPLFDQVKFEGGTAKVTFLPGTATGLSAKDGEPVKGFALAGEDKKFMPAEAKIVGVPAPGANKAAEKMLIVTSLAVPRPVAIRYAWADNPSVNLVNQAGLPASSFRSDDWR